MPGWSWNPQGDSWAQKYGALQNYVKREATRKPKRHVAPPAYADRAGTSCSFPTHDSNFPKG